MMNQDETDHGLELHVEITELPSTAVPSPLPEQFPEGLADTGVEPWILLIAASIFVIGGLCARMTRRKRA